MQCSITKGGNKSFNVCNVHRFVIGDQGQQASTAPLCIQSCSSEAGAAHLMHLFSISLRSHTHKKPCSGIPSHMFCLALAPFVIFVGFSFSLICCCETVVRVGEAYDVAVVISCVS